MTREIQHKIQPQIQQAHILYEDDTLLVANKPAHLPSQGTENPTKPHFLSLLQSFVCERDKKQRRLVMHHRLDSATSGLMIFGKDPHYNKGLADLFSGGHVEKTYHAVVEVGAEGQKFFQHKDWEVKNFLKSMKKGAYQKVIACTQDQGGLMAHTLFEQVRKDENAQKMLVICRPQTGRTHQIRVHLADCTMPVLGDLVYGRSHPLGRLMLHASALRFTHPKTRKKLLIESSIPEIFTDALI